MGKYESQSMIRVGTKYFQKFSIGQNFPFWAYFSRIAQKDAYAFFPYLEKDAVIKSPYMEKYAVPDQTMTKSMLR